MKHAVPPAEGFRVPGEEVTRLEGFGDAAFGFALTLLVVSLEVPKTFGDLMATMRGVPAFAACFVILVIIWNYLLRTRGWSAPGASSWQSRARGAWSEFAGRGAVGVSEN